MEPKLKNNRKYILTVSVLFTFYAIEQLLLEKESLN